LDIFLFLIFPFHWCKAEKCGNPVPSCWKRK
jgi:hypothetical protein